MMVCLCEGVSERKVRKAIEHGATTVEAVAATCRAGGCCMGCHPTIESLIAEHAPAGARVGRGVRFVVA
jgi:bacterioferritin-associated ferredoxin